MRAVSTGGLCLCLAACGASGAEPLAPPDDPVVREATFGNSDAPDRYRLQLTDGGARLSMTLWLEPLEIEVPADLPDVPGRARRRALIHDLRCGDRAVAVVDEGWRLPTGCRALHWTVELQAPSETGIEPRDRLAFRDTERGWWYVPGAAVFIAPDSMAARPTLELELPDEVPAYHTLSDTGRLGLALPPRSRLGDVTLGLGNWRERASSDGTTRIRHLSDREMDVDLPGLPAGMAYLADVTGESAPARLDVFWLGRPFEVARLSGTAGVGALTVNYYPEVLEDAHSTRRHAPLAALLQQYFHSLTGHLLPQWASLSLGQYYALLAWVEAGAITEEARQSIVRAGVPGSGPETPLLTLWRVYDRTGEDEAWRAFVVSGLAFWATLDRHLSEAGGAEGSLDNVLQDLLRLVYARNGTPPARFLEVLVEAGGEETTELLRNWLGWPPADVLADEGAEAPPDDPT